MKKAVQATGSPWNIAVSCTAMGGSQFNKQ
jgi:hypothetical protein